mmetsp:Transcript_36143/g.89027  ORF Transcript_36143/g.89027 Transcript_36143/m.89027 type:complete len:228 (+) Transcript_36143:269-952(+)
MRLRISLTYTLSPLAELNASWLLMTHNAISRRSKSSGGTRLAPAQPISLAEGGALLARNAFVSAASACTTCHAAWLRAPRHPSAWSSRSAVAAAAVASGCEKCRNILAESKGTSIPSAQRRPPVARTASSTTRAIDALPASRPHISMRGASPVKSSLRRAAVILTPAEAAAAAVLSCTTTVSTELGALTRASASSSKSRPSLSILALFLNLSGEVRANSPTSPMSSS